jgi:hypothetical protein
MNASRSSKIVQPRLIAPRSWIFSSYGRFRTASEQMLSRLRYFSSRPGRLHTPPQAPRIV